MMPKDSMPSWAKEQVKDERDAKKAESAYNKAMVNTPAAPKKKYAEGGEVKPEGGRFDEDTYARARAWMEKQGKETPAPKAKPTPAPKAQRKPADDEAVMGDEVRKRTRAKIAMMDAEDNMDTLDRRLRTMTPPEAARGSGRGTMAGATARDMEALNTPRKPFGRNPRGKTPAEFRAEKEPSAYAKGGSVKGYGKARGGKACKMY